MATVEDLGDWRKEQLILRAMDAALDTLRTPDGHNSGAYFAVWVALRPLCASAYDRRAKERERISRAGLNGPLGT